MEKIIIAAVAENGAIGRENALLWHISADMKYFRNTTTGYPVIMGYKTWESIGRPLPGRTNIVITRTPFDAPTGVLQVADVQSALDAASRPVGGGEAPEKCFIIGGAKTYERSMQMADELYITNVHTVVSDADAFFPAIDPAVWVKASETPVETDPENGLMYSFVIYKRLIDK